MKEPDIPANEEERLRSLRQYKILDTLPEKEYDAITKIAAQIFDTPISLVSIVDSDRQWFKSVYGVDAKQTPRKDAFCAHAILDPLEIMVVPDSRKDERFNDNPLVIGEPHVIFYAGVPLLNPEGYSLGTLCVIDKEPRSITKQQLESLRALGSQVVSLMELRKANEKLIMLKNDLEKRNKELEEFAMVVSHDIKSPLAHIISLTELLEFRHSSRLNKEGVDLVNFINQSAYKVKALVESILTYYQGDKILKLEHEVLDLVSFLKSVTALLGHSEEKYLHINYPSEEIWIDINKIATEQIFLNLISNSIKYNDKENIIVDISFNQDDKFYYFTVKDNGTGVDEKDQEKIFNLFTTLNTPDRFGNFGTGIGLSVVKKLVESQGGKLSLLSGEEQGAVFEFTIRKRNR